MIDSIFGVLLSLFAIIISGSLANKYNILPKEASVYFNKFVFYISVPSIVFLSIATFEIEKTFNFLPFIIVNILIVFFGYILVYLISKLTKLSKNKKGVLIYSSNGGNVVYFGFPIMLTLFGTEYFNLAVLYATVVISIGDLMGFYLLGINSRDKKVNIKEEILSFLKNPIVLATVIGIFALFLGVSIPTFFADSLDTLGKTTTGLALFSLGIILYGELNLKDVKLNLVTSSFKLLVLPLIAFIFAYGLFGLSGSVAEVSVLMAAMPTAVFSLIVADAYDLDRKLAFNIIVLTSILFLFTFNIWISILNI